MELSLKYVLRRRALATAWGLVYLLVAMLPLTSAHAGKKAFIVAINGYQNLTPLATPFADGAAMQIRLQELGFTVTLVKDATRDDFRAKWNDFKGAVTREDDVVFYFAGHGVQIETLNHLLLRNSPGLNAGRPARVAASGSFHEILDELQARARRAIFILDAAGNVLLSQSNPVGNTKYLKEIQAITEVPCVIDRDFKLQPDTPVPAGYIEF